MRVGFTGTRKGMTAAQHAAVSKLLSEVRPSEVHHGDCVGADAQFHLIARKALGVDGIEPYIIGHPPTQSALRAFCRNVDERREPKDFIARNRDIVMETDVLIAAPREMEPPASLKGHGTWSTYFYAKDKARKQTYLVLPDGTII